MAEVDRVGALESRLLALAAQLQLETRKSGRTAAELQNQALTVSVQLNPATTVGRHYVGGGSDWTTGQVHGAIDRLSHLSDVLSPIDFSLALPRMRHSGFSSAARGYWLGGETNWAFSATNNVEAINFANERRVAIASTLTANRAYGRGTQSSTRGYSGGNWSLVASVPTTTVPSPVERMTFSTEAIAVLGINLASVSAGCMVTETAVNAYFAGGFGNTFQIQRLNFGAETNNPMSAQLSVKRVAGSSSSSQLKGYYVTGVNLDAGLSTAVTSIEAFRFSNETIATLTAQLSKADADASGASALRQGYHFHTGMPGQAGGDLTSWLETLSYASETTSRLSAVLSRGGRYVAPVGKI